jgi:ribonuclease P protein component
MLSVFCRIPSLKNSAAFQTVLHDSKTLRLRSRWVDLFISQGREAHCLGLVVSKRCYKRAVDRNRVKRLFKEYIRLNVRKYPSIAVIIRLKQPLEALTFEAVASILDELFFKAFPTSKALP